jgi:acetyl esterase/lipase
MIQRFFFAGVLLSAFAASAFGQSPKVEADVVYGKAGDRELKLDLCRPTTGKGPYPAVVCLHGGGWRMGNKKELRGWLELLAERGFVAISVGYRLAPDAVFPSQIVDCKTATRFLRANAAKYDIDKSRIGAMGFSAGGHLVCLMGLCDSKCGFEGELYADQSSDVQCVVNYFGPADFAGFKDDASAQRSMIGPFIGAKFDEKPDLHKKASPVEYVKKEAPPMLIFHGTKDWIVPIEQSRQLKEKLKARGASVELIEVPDEGHGWQGQKGLDTTRATLEFFAKHLKK